MTLTELGTRMSQNEFNEWLAYFKIEAEGGTPSEQTDDLKRRAEAGLKKK